MDKKSPIGLYGVLGFPAKHSLSPLMHNAAFRALKINAEYRIFEVKPEELDDFLDERDKNNIYGLNVTVPYKEKILESVELDSESFYLKQIRAINTIVKKDGIWKGFNTDMPGFQRHLKENFDPSDKKVAILGAGGAARAVVYVLANAGTKEIAIFDIDRAKAKNISEMIKGLFSNFQIFPVDSIDALDLKNKNLLVNATPIGLNESDPPLVTTAMIHKDLFVYDLIYNPLETKLLQIAKKVGARTSNGLGMLLYQGALSFAHFTGKPAPVEIMREALNKGVNKI
ncbi:MAG: shikimate dehydrogenase [Omnitrophica WOR_2 bacterium RBG_13_44_8b]|nr:MAG: shikimate dehydrogenase [Omnitrophica WOR_2 bacterium RBG_13_44_8b]